MAASNKKLVIVGLLLAIAIIGSEPIMTNAQFCGMTKGDLEECKPSANGHKPQVQPTSACCTAISTANLDCLCGFKNSALLKIYKIDPDQAMALPILCGFKGSSWHC